MNKWLKRAGIGFGGLIALLLVVAGTVYAITERRLTKSYAVEPKPVAIASDSATIARGEHVVKAIGKCADCHGADLGGYTMIDDPAFARLSAPNLTRGVGGILGERTDADLVRAIRHGLGKDGRPLLIMPSDLYSAFSDADLAAVVAYLRSVPAVDRERPATMVGPVARVLMAAGKLPVIPAERIAHASVAPSTVPAGVTREYGEYLATVGGCKGCHGPGLSGGPEPGGPPDMIASNITPAGIGHWTEEDYFRALRAGKRPDGSAIKETMPWKATALMTDDEIRATWIYLKTVPARPFGNR